MHLASDLPCPHHPGKQHRSSWASAAIHDKNRHSFERSRDPGPHGRPGPFTPTPTGPPSRSLGGRPLPLHGLGQCGKARRGINSHLGGGGELEPLFTQRPPPGGTFPRVQTHHPLFPNHPRPGVHAPGGHSGGIGIYGTDGGGSTRPHRNRVSGPPIWPGFATAHTPSARGEGSPGSAAASSAAAPSSSSSTSAWRGASVWQQWGGPGTQCQPHTMGGAEGTKVVKSSLGPCQTFWRPPWKR